MDNIKDLFYKPVRIKHDDNDILMWGCTHYDHACEKWDTPLYKKRGYEDLQKHNNAIINNWNSKASDTTIGFLLGDIMFGVGGKEKFEKFINNLIFDKLYVMAGNHFAGWKQSFESIEGNTAIIGNKTIIFVPNYLELIINGQPIVTSHYPILSWNGMGKGSWMIHSHVHGTLEYSEIGKLYKRSNLKVYEVSVESNEYPASLYDIKKFMEKQGGGSVDHHDIHTKNPF